MLIISAPLFRRRAGRALVAACCAWLASPLQAAEPAPGLAGVLFGDPAMTRPRELLILSRPDHEAPEWPDERDFGLRLLGSLQLPAAGPIILRVETGHDVRISVEDGEEVGISGGTTTLELSGQAGDRIRLNLEYAQSDPPSRLRVSWRLPGQESETVPASAYTHDRSDLAALESIGIRPERNTLLEVVNPDPRRLGSLEVSQVREQLLVSATLPAVPGFVCDSWCYESAMEFLDCRDFGDGRLELRHRLNASPEILVVTQVTPSADSVEFLARLVREDGRNGPWPENPVIPNLCWQLKRSPAFASRPEPYPAFVARCFIFTEAGQTFLDRTERRPIPVRSADDYRNNPPWVQIYGLASEPPKRSGPGAWADYSPDRFTIPVVGAVSRDGRYLAALATGAALNLCQAWHDCMHINANWGPPDGRTWRLMVYAMENDPAALLARVARDFPELQPQLAGVPLQPQSP